MATINWATNVFIKLKYCSKYQQLKKFKKKKIININIT